MTIYTCITTFLWFVFIAYWAISAFSTKKSAGRRINWRRSILLRLLIIVAVITMIHIHSHAKHPGRLPAFPPDNPVWNPPGVVLCAMGIALAIWARIYLGRNWGIPMSLRQNHELVTGGPYIYIRHPIYSGILLALFGSALAGDIRLLLVFLAYIPYVFFCAGVEEKMMIEQFPDQYPRYQQKTRRLIPFIY